MCFISSGAKVEHRDHENFTALLVAAKYGHTETIATLLKNRAKVNAVDKYDKTVIHQCSEESHPEALKVLRKKRRTKMTVYNINIVNYSK